MLLLARPRYSYAGRYGCPEKWCAKTDKEFAKRARKNGLRFYADEMVVKPVPGGQPIFGKHALMEILQPAQYETHVGTPSCEASGNLGYTFWELHIDSRKTAAGTRFRFNGNYISVWKRKSDGGWRYVMFCQQPSTSGLRATFQ